MSIANKRESLRQEIEQYKKKANIEKFADIYDVREFKIKGIDKFDDNQIIFIGRDYVNDKSSIVIDFNNKSLEAKRIK